MIYNETAISFKNILQASATAAIDDHLMAEAIELSQLKTKKAVVATELRILIQIKKQERIKSLRGKLNWVGDLEKMRVDQ